jgi:hypothetical protein
MAYPAGYQGDIEKLWEAAQKQNTEAAAIQRLELLIDAPRAHRQRPLGTVVEVSGGSEESCRSDANHGSGY